MTSAIARWHSSARPPSDALELAYADRLEAEMQELAIQLHKVGGRQGAGGYVQKWQERCLEIDTCREGHSDRTERAESMTAPTVKERDAGRPTGRRPRKIWDIRRRSGVHPQERVRPENKRLEWTPVGSQEGTQSRGGSTVETHLPFQERDRQRHRMGWFPAMAWGLCLLHPWPTCLPRLPVCQPHLPPLSLQRCEEVEAMRGQVSQEQELRAVVESCLLEQDSTRKDILAQLQETWALAQDAALILDQLQ